MEKEKILILTQEAPIVPIIFLGSYMLYVCCIIIHLFWQFSIIVHDFKVCFQLYFKKNTYRII